MKALCAAALLHSAQFAALVQAAWNAALVLGSVTDGKVTLMTKEMTKPNGIAFSPDEKTLYVSNSDPDKAVWMAFDVKDDDSPIQRVEYSQDGLVWRPAFPRDGIADSKSEQYDVTIEGELGPRGLSIRASDAMNNVATTQVDSPGAR